METLASPIPMNPIVLEESYVLEKVEFPNRIREIGELRIRAWKNEPGIDTRFFSKDAWIEDVDEEAHHWIITKDGLVVAAARISFHDRIEDTPYSELLGKEHLSRFDHKSIASINRLVVDPRYRGLGFARALDLVRIQLAADRSVDVVVAQPQKSRLHSLSKLGFTFVCDLESTPEMPERPLYFMLMNLK